jgi:hypothetical protein
VPRVPPDGPFETYCQSANKQEPALAAKELDISRDFKFNKKKILNITLFTLVYLCLP